MVKRSSEAGFTMIEVMVAMLLTAIAIIGILALFMAQTRASGYSRHMTEATALCQDKLEQLRTLTASSVGISGTDNNLDEKGVSGTGIYTRTWTWVTQTSWVDLTCTMQWTEDGASKTLTVISRRNL
jgi:Tfp pilus assembly protein PilV